MDEPHPAAGQSDLSELAAAAREHQVSNPAGQVSVPADPGVRLAAAACDAVLALFFCLTLSCTGFLSLMVLLGVDPEGPLADNLFFTLVSFAAVLYTSPEAFGWPTFAKSWFRLGLSALHPDKRRCYRRRWLLKASPLIVLFAILAVGAVRAAVVASLGGYPGPGAWLSPSTTMLITAVPGAFVAVGFLTCFGAGRQSVYDRIAGTLLVQTRPRHRLHDRGFEVVPMAAVADAGTSGPAGLAGPAGGGYAPAADHE